jgi:hypothetical protein
VNTTIQLSVEQRAAIDKLLASETFLHAPRVHAVLKFLLESLQDGDLDQINEQAIGRAVFGRPIGYNAAEDNIVRVTVRHLRARLDRFYRSEGADEEWIVEIPRGNYVPVLRPRAVTQEEVPEMLLAEPAELPDLEAGHSSRRKISPRTIWLFAAILLISNLLTFYVARTIAGNSSLISPRAGLVPALFSNPNRHLSVVLTDSNLEAYRMVVNQVVSLSAYLDRSYLQRPDQQNQGFEQGTWKYIGRGEDTTLSSVLVADRLQSSLSHRALDIRHPRSLSIRDFNRDDFILLGGPWINPWGQLFENRLNFRIVSLGAEASGSRILNVDPKPGEPAFFAGHTNGAFSVGYARLAVLPNLTNTGKVILVGATDEEALDGGGNFLIQPEYLAELLKIFSVSSASELPFFEVVLEVTGVDSNPCNVRIVAVRVVKIPSGLRQ